MHIFMNIFGNRSIMTPGGNLVARV